MPDTFYTDIVYYSSVGFTCYTQLCVQCRFCSEIRKLSDNTEEIDTN